MSAQWTGFIKELLFGKYAYVFCAVKYAVVLLPVLASADSVQKALEASRPIFGLLTLDLAYFAAVWAFLNCSLNKITAFVRVSGHR